MGLCPSRGSTTRLPAQNCSIQVSRGTRVSRSLQCTWPAGALCAAMRACGLHIHRTQPLGHERSAQRGPRFRVHTWVPASPPEPSLCPVPANVGRILLLALAETFLNFSFRESMATAGAQQAQFQRCSARDSYGHSCVDRGALQRAQVMHKTSTRSGDRDVWSVERMCALQCGCALLVRTCSQPTCMHSKGLQALAGHNRTGSIWSISPWGGHPRLGGVPDRQVCRSRLVGGHLTKSVDESPRSPACRRP